MKSRWCSVGLPAERDTLAW